MQLLLGQLRVVVLEALGWVPMLPAMRQANRLDPLYNISLPASHVVSINQLGASLPSPSGNPFGLLNIKLHDLQYNLVSAYDSYYTG